VSICPRPLDPIDVEAVASGAEPPFAPDAAGHAAACVSCGAAVERARGLALELEGLSRAVPTVVDLVPRVTRLRAFSARERRTYALWRAPILLSAATAAVGLLLLLAPSLTAGDQAGLATAALVPILAFVRALARWAPALVAVAPSGLEALSDALHQERLVGLVSLLLLVPAAFGLRRAFARARGRR
jgi:predicted component of type VI protein secretion system